MHEKLIFKDVKNLKIQGINEENMELEIQLRPDEDILYLIRRVGPSSESCSYKLSNYTRLSYNEEVTPEEFREKGKKTQISEEVNGQQTIYQ